MIKNTMVDVGRKVVFDLRGIKIVREKSYGWGCNGISTMWYVYRGDTMVGSYERLKRAKLQAEGLARVVV